MKKKSKKYNLLVYVEKSSPKLKKFDTSKEMGKFIDQFLKDHPDYQSMNSDNWVDYAITDVEGEVHFFTDGITLE